MRSVSVLRVSDPALWAEIEARGTEAGDWLEVLDPTARVVSARFEREVLPKLGDEVLVRYARRTEPATVVSPAAAQPVPMPSRAAGSLLFALQRVAVGGQVLRATIDPSVVAGPLRELLGAGLIADAGLDDAASAGWLRLSGQLPPPPPVAYDLLDAVMPMPDDVAPAGLGPLSLLHDLASFAAALLVHPAVRTHAGTLTRADGRKLGRRLGDAVLVADGEVEGHPRWSRALRGLELLSAVTMDPVTRALYVDPGLEDLLSGTATESTDRFVRRLIEPDLHPLLPAVAAGLRQAGPEAVDEVVFLELLREQHRDVLVMPWVRGAATIYPAAEGDPIRLYDDDAFDAVERPSVRRLLTRLDRLGVVRRGAGVFAATDDGLVWADSVLAPPPPVWVSSDLEVLVPPHAVTPWERFQLERLSRCLSRDVVDRYRLEQGSMRAWLAVHRVEEALDLLARRCPGVPENVRQTLLGWARASERIVLTRGVRLD